MSFKTFLSARKATYDAKGDFVRLAASDPNLPDALSWAELQTHMDEQHYSYKISEAGQEVWREYQISEKKLRKA